jgi:hypothetical protein
MSGGALGVTSASTRWRAPMATAAGASSSVRPALTTSKSHQTGPPTPNINAFLRPIASSLLPPLPQIVLFESVRAVYDPRVGDAIPFATRRATDPLRSHIIGRPPNPAAQLGCLWPQVARDSLELCSNLVSWCRPRPWSVAAWQLEHEPYFDSDSSQPLGIPRAAPPTLPLSPGLANQPRPPVRMPRLLNRRVFILQPRCMTAQSPRLGPARHLLRYGRRGI